MKSGKANLVLIADDEAAVLSQLSDILQAEGFRVVTASTGEEALEAMKAKPIELLVADLSMPEMGGIELARHVHEEWPHIPVVILTGNATVESAVDAMRLGAADYLLKPVDPGELLVRLQKLLEVSALRSEHSRLSAQVKKEGRYGEIIGANPKMRKIFDLIHRVAATPSRVLIHGEPGTGKELIARAIHERSCEAKKREAEVEGIAYSDLDHPYIAVNCGAFSRTLLESQLFGHRKGTFTGAISDQEGVFVAAKSGTLFLDEITELDLDLQVSLLRAIEEQEVTPLGSTQPVPIHARIITATNRPIAELVRESKFRADLYYRINVVNISVPPLKDRVDDIPLLLAYFLKSTAATYKVGTREVTPEVMAAFQSFNWPGNVRELRNVIERAFALGMNENLIGLEDLPPELLKRTDLNPLDSGDGQESSFPSFDQVVRTHLVKALQISRGTKTRAASILKIDRNRLYRLMRKYAIPMEGE